MLFILNTSFVVRIVLVNFVHFFSYNFFRTILYYCSVCTQRNVQQQGNFLAYQKHQAIEFIMYQIIKHERSVIADHSMRIENQFCPVLNTEYSNRAVFKQCKNSSFFCNHTNLEFINYFNFHLNSQLNESSSNDGNSN